MRICNQDAVSCRLIIYNMVTVNDEHYIRLVKEGDTNAFAVLVNRYKDMIFTLSLKMLKDREEAEEVSQDTFVKIYKSLGKFNGEAKFSTWIYKIAFNTCLDRLKKNKRAQPVTTLMHLPNMRQLFNKCIRFYRRKGTQTGDTRLFGFVTG